MISSLFPFPPTKGGIQTRIFHLLRYLSERHQVILVTQRPPEVIEDHIEALREWVQELVIFPRRLHSPQQDLISRAKRFGQFLQHGTPQRTRFHHSPQMQDWIEQAVAAQRFDVITSEHSIDEIYVRPEWQQHLHTVINIHNSLSGTCQHYLETYADPQKGIKSQLNLPILRRYEQRYCSKFSTVVATTVEDRKQLKTLKIDKPITVVPNGVDLHQFPQRNADPGGWRLVYYGELDNPTNIYALHFLCQSVFPELRRRYREVTLEIIGTNPTPEVKALAQLPGITVSGEQVAVAAALQKATVCVLPVLTGYGIKQPTLEAMAAGVPVVGSDRAFAGLPIDGMAPLAGMRANQLEEYVYAIGRLLQDPPLRNKISLNARALIQRDYTWRQAGARYEQALSVAHPARA